MNTMISHYIDIHNHAVTIKYDNSPKPERISVCSEDAVNFERLSAEDKKKYILFKIHREKKDVGTNRLHVEKKDILLDFFYGGGDKKCICNPLLAQPTVEALMVATPTVVEPTVEAPKVVEPTVEEPTVEAPTTALTVDEPTVDDPTEEAPTVDEPTVETQTIVKATIEVSTVDEVRALGTNGVNALLDNEVKTAIATLVAAGGGLVEDGIERKGVKKQREALIAFCLTV